MGISSSKQRLSSTIKQFELRRSATMTHFKLCVFLACMMALTVVTHAGKEAKDLEVRSFEDLVERSLKDLAKKEALEHDMELQRRSWSYRCYIVKNKKVCGM